MKKYIAIIVVVVAIACGLLCLSYYDAKTYLSDRLNGMDNIDRLKLRLNGFAFHDSQLSRGYFCIYYTIHDPNDSALTGNVVWFGWPFRECFGY